MATQNYLRLFLHSWKRILGLTLLGLLLAVGLSFTQPLEYSSSVRLLITQTDAADLDPYTALKSTERIADNLTEIIYTTSFFNAVMQGSTIDQSYFPTDPIDRRNLWAKTISTSVLSGTGIMTVTAYHPSRDTAQELAVRTAQELAAVTPNYFGYSVRVQVIDDPLPSRFIAKPDFVENGILGAVAGFLLGTAWVLWKPRQSAA